MIKEFNWICCIHYRRTEKWTFWPYRTTNWPQSWRWLWQI